MGFDLGDIGGALSGGLGSIFGGGQGGLGQGLGGLGTALLGGGNVKTNYDAPQIDTSGTNAALGQIMQGKQPQQEAMDLTKSLATGTGPSLATNLLQQQSAATRAGTDALASSGTGAAGQGLARRQAMMQGAQAQQDLGGRAATARATEQLGGISALGGLSTAARGQEIQSGLGAAGIQSDLAKSQAGLQAQTNALNVQGQESNQQAGNDMMKNIMGGVAGLAMMSDPAAKADVKPASSERNALAGFSAGFSGKSPKDIAAMKAAMSPQSVVRAKHSSLYKPGILDSLNASVVGGAMPGAMQGAGMPAQGTSADYGQMFSSPPEAKTDIQLASAPKTWGGEVTPPYRIPETGKESPEPSLLPHTGSHRNNMPPASVVVSANPDTGRYLEVLTNQHGYIDPSTVEHSQPFSSAESDSDYAKFRAEAQRQHEEEVMSGRGNPYDSRRPLVLQTPEFDVNKYNQSVIQKYYTHKQPANKAAPLKHKMPAWMFGGEDEVASDPQAKQDASQGNDVEGALRNLNPYSYRYKNPANEPIPNPTGMERFFGVMTTDMKKHPTTASMVSGEGGEEKIAIPAATSFALASVAHLQKKVDALEALLHGKNNGGQ